MRFVGAKNGSIKVVSNTKFENSNYSVIPVPESLSAFSNEDLIKNFKVHSGEIMKKRTDLPTSKQKIAFVGNWKMKCGISTYSENLLPHLAKEFGHVKLFIEENSEPTGDVYELDKSAHLTEDQVVICWKRGESLKQLVKELKDYNPDIILIQHEFGLWHNASRWLSFMTQISQFRVFVTMHSVFYHEDKTICEAAMQNIIVHLDGAKKVLKELKKVPGKVTVIPHGCYDYSPARLWNFYKTEKTFLQFGFGFRYKGWENSIRAVAILKEKHPDVFFTGLFSESPFNEADHQIYYEELTELVNQLGLEENVAIIRGYQSDECLDSYLKTNTAAVFPYVSHPDHEVFGASGAARLAMARGCAVVTTRVNHFSDIPSLKGDTPEEIANALDAVFSSKPACAAQISVQKAYVSENSWKKIAQKYIKLFEQ